MRGYMKNFGIIGLTQVCLFSVWTSLCSAQTSGLYADFVVRVCAGIVNQTITITRGTYTDPNGAQISWSSGDSIKIERPGEIPKIVNNVGKGDYNSCISGIVQALSTQPPRKCRIRQNGIERYTRQFLVTQSSPEMSGGHSPGEWCNTMIGGLRGQHPDGNFTAVSTSESSRSGCPPFNCPLYRYQCTVSVETDAIYKEEASPLCP